VLCYKIDFASPLLKGNHEKILVVKDLWRKTGGVDSGSALRVLVRVRANRFWQQARATSVDEHQPLSG
jgi:hypothetical protein